MPLIVLLLLIGAWFYFGDPPGTVAGWLWPNDAAPWEQVDAFYYPDRGNLAVDQRRRDVGSVEGCRDWVFAAAAANNDRSLRRGDYECGVGLIESFGGIGVYRLTVR
jgi:hypothetical protein